MEKGPCSRQGGTVSRGALRRHGELAGSSFRFWGGSQWHPLALQTLGVRGCTCQTPTPAALYCGLLTEKHLVFGAVVEKFPALPVSAGAGYMPGWDSSDPRLGISFAQAGTRRTPNQDASFCRLFQTAPAPPPREAVFEGGLGLGQAGGTARR